MYKDVLSNMLEFMSRPHCCHDLLFVPGVVEFDDYGSGTCAPRSEAQVCAINFDVWSICGAVYQAQYIRQPGFKKKLNRIISLYAFPQINNANIVSPGSVFHVIQAFGHGLDFLFRFS